MRANFTMAMLATLIANASRDPKQKSEPYTVEDFMLVDYGDGQDDDVPDYMRIMQKFKQITDHEVDE